MKEWSEFETKKCQGFSSAIINNYITQISTTKRIKVKWQTLICDNKTTFHPKKSIVWGKKKCTLRDEI